MFEFINKYVFGIAVPIMLVLAGIYYIFILKAFHIRKIKSILRAMLKKQDKNGVSPFRAVTLALAGTLGVGNIVGVSSAIALGGFGSIFWMWISAFCAMLLKYAEIVLAMRHRRYDSHGNPHGSAMIYIKDYFSSIGLSRLGGFVSLIFALFCIVNSLTMGSMIQINAVSNSFRSVFGISPVFVGGILCALTYIIISSGSQRISRFTEMLVPIMSAGYIILSLAVIFIRIDRVDDAMLSIFSSAFKSDSMIGGVLGFVTSRALRYGSMRGLVSNEAGCGTAPAAHATSNSKSAAEQGFWGIFEVFVDTIVLCTLTAIVVIISYPEVSCYQNNFIMMTVSAYSAVLGDFASYFLAISVLFFAFATILCWAHYGMESVGYLTDKKYLVRLFILIYSASVFCGSILASDIIWSAADLAIGVMSFINIFVILLMNKEVREETEEYFNI